jgi:DNA-binding transcriptional LysR family regulator
MRLLEEEVGATLLERGRKGVGVRVTAAGEVVLRHARSMLNQRRQLLTELEALRGLKQGELKIGLPPVGSAEIFADLIAEYRDLYPDIAVQLLERGGEALEQAVRAGEIDFAATLLPVQDDLETLFVHREPIVLAVPRNHPLTKRRQVRVADLEQIPFVMLEQGFVLNRRVREVCIANGFSPLEAARSAHPNFALALVAAGVGVMCLPRLVAAQHTNRGVRLIAFTADMPDWQLALVWRKGVSLSFAAQAWLQLVEIRYTKIPVTPVTSAATEQ